MLTLILHRGARGRPLPARSFYRVEVADNLFGEYSVRRKGGRAGRGGRKGRSCFPTLRDAVLPADSCIRRAQARGYHLTERRLAQR